MRSLTAVSMVFFMWTGLVRAEQPTAYRLDVRIIPASGEIHVRGQVTIELDQANPEDYTFDLHETFHITTLKVNATSAEYHFAEATPSSINPTARKVEVRLPSETRDRRIEMFIAYHGKIRELPSFGTPGSDGPFLDDTVSSERVELTSYSSWFPSFGFGSSFDVELDVSLPLEWKVVCIGRQTSSQRLESRQVTRWTGNAVNDLVIVASPRLEVKDVETTSGRVRIYHTRLPETFVLQEANETEKTLQFFQEKIGSPPLSDGVVKHVYSPRKWGQGGYSRIGMIVASEGRVLEYLSEDPNASFLRGLAHEMGHFWWNFGADQGDWINEAFAEFFSLLAVREIQGEEAFEASLAQRRNAVLELPEEAPALSAVPASNEGHGYTIRYFKGALMLDHFRQLIGDQAFYRSSGDFYQKFRDKRISTDEFRAFWTNALGSNRKQVSIWLDDKGGLPEQAPSIRFEPGRVEGWRGTL